MYRVIRASVLYYEHHMRGAAGRYELVEPFLLLVNLSDYDDARKRMSPAFLNLCDIISEMRLLHMRDNDKYHHFNMLIKELDVLGFEVSKLEAAHVTPDAVLKDQIDLLLQFFAFRYPFDEYDNKTGSHDLASNKYIFIQP